MAEVAATFGPVGGPAAFAGDRRTGAAARPREPTLGASSDLRPATQAGLHRLRDERSAASRRCGTVETMLFFRNRRRRHSAHGMRTPIEHERDKTATAARVKQGGSAEPGAVRGPRETRSGSKAVARARGSRIVTEPGRTGRATRFAATRALGVSCHSFE